MDPNQPTPGTEPAPEQPTKPDPAPSLRFGGITPQAYWKRNIMGVCGLLVVWFLVSFGCGILWVDELDKIKTPGGGVKLGFWFAQQGSIYVFVALIGIYVVFMNKLDAKFHGEKR